MDRVRERSTVTKNDDDEQHGGHTSARSIHLWYWISMLWLIDIRHNKISTDHIAGSGLYPGIIPHRAHVFFFKSTGDQVLVFVWITGSSQVDLLSSGAPLLGLNRLVMFRYKSVNRFRCIISLLLNCFRCRCWIRVCLKLSFNVCGTWCPGLVDNPRYTLGRELVARVCHIWCDLCVLEHLAVRIPKADFFDQERAGKRALRIPNHSQTGIS